MQRRRLAWRLLSLAISKSDDSRKVPVQAQNKGALGKGIVLVIIHIINYCSLWKYRLARYVNLGGGITQNTQPPSKSEVNLLFIIADWLLLPGLLWLKLIERVATHPLPIN